MIFELDFLSISNLIFAGYTGSKNQVWNRQKIKFKNQFCELEVPKIKCRSTGGKSQPRNLTVVDKMLYLKVHNFRDYDQKFHISVCITSRKLPKIVYFKYFLTQFKSAYCQRLLSSRMHCSRVYCISRKLFLWYTLDQSLKSQKTCAWLKKMCPCLKVSQSGLCWHSKQKKYWEPILVKE